MRPRGFSLLEVMVAVAILGLTLTVILSAQGGLAASNKMAGNMGLATSLGRCKMTELEEKLLKLGYPLNDDLNTGVSCCSDRDDSVFTCDTRVEKIQLPNPPENSMDGGSFSLGALASASAAPGSSGLAGLGALGGAIAPALGGSAAGGAGLDFDGGLQGLGAGLMQQLGSGAGASSGLGMQGLLQMVMGMVYPSLKPMFEASIRRLTVTVKWNEGPNPKQLALVQYVTNPQQSGFVAGAIASAGSSAGGATLAPPPAGPGNGPTSGPMLPPGVRGF